MRQGTEFDLHTAADLTAHGGQEAVQVCRWTFGYPPTEGVLDRRNDLSGSHQNYDGFRHWKRMLAYKHNGVTQWQQECRSCHELARLLLPFASMAPPGRVPPPGRSGVSTSSPPIAGPGARSGPRARGRPPPAALLLAAQLLLHAQELLSGQRLIAWKAEARKCQAR